MKRIRETEAFKLNLGLFSIKKINVEEYQEFLEELDVELERVYNPADESLEMNSTTIERIGERLHQMLKVIQSRGYVQNEREWKLVLEDIIRRNSIKYGVALSQLVLIIGMQVGHHALGAKQAGNQAFPQAQSEGYNEVRENGLRELEEYLARITREEVSQVLTGSAEMFTELNELDRREKLRYASITVEVPQKKDGNPLKAEEIPVDTLQRIYKAIQLPDNRDTNGLSEWHELSWILKESWGQHDAVSRSGASGFIQLMPGTAEEVAQWKGLEDFDLTNPKDNLELGYTYLEIKRKEILQIIQNRGFTLGEGSRTMSEDDFRSLVFAAYNAGTGNVMGMFDKFLMYEKVENGEPFVFSWNHFSLFLSSRIHEQRAHNSYFESYEYPPEIAVYFRKPKLGSIHVGKIEEMQHYPLYIESMAKQLPEKLQQLIEEKTEIEIAA